jgi:hypothetical protein
LLGKSLTYQLEESLFRRNDRLRLLAEIEKSRQELEWQPKVILCDGLRMILEHEGMIMPTVRSPLYRGIEPR